MNFVPAIALKGIDSLIESLGEDPNKLMLEIDFMPELLERPDNLIEGQQFNDLIEHSARQLNQRFFGLQLAAIQGGSILGSLWFLLRNSSTIEEAIQALLENYAHHTEITYFRAEKNPMGTLLTYDIDPSIQGESTQTIELGLAIVCLDLRRYLGNSWRPKALYLKCIEPYEKRPLIEVFGENIFFNQEVNGILATKEELKLPLNNSSQLKQKHYKQEVNKKKDFSPQSAVVQTENIINASLTRHRCSLDFVAKCLGRSPRTLRHQLQLQGTCYKDILLKAKLNASLRYLTQSNLTISEIAERLHFSETSVFSRFIKKHTGLSPRQYKSSGTSNNK